MDGERPDTVSYHLYGTTNFYWTFFILNNELRAGLNSAWPLSSQQLEKMLEREYDAYTAITFLPIGGAVNGISSNGIINLVYLWEAYLPYLRLTNTGGTEWAKILKYDNQLLQVVVYDVEKSDGSGPVASIDTFKNSTSYKIAWANPYDEITEADAWLECDLLRLEFIEKMVAVYAEFDSYATDESSLPDDLSQEELISYIQSRDNTYVFNKTYLPANTNYRWASYRNAASEYYKEVDGIKYSMSAFDVVSDETIIEPKYISFYEKEYEINARKEKIRVIRKDKINDFVNAYFNTLNAR
jgi:hypothetical protein